MNFFFFLIVVESLVGTCRVEELLNPGLSRTLLNSVFLKRTIESVLCFQDKCKAPRGSLRAHVSLFPTGHSIYPTRTTRTTLTYFRQFL